MNLFVCAVLVFLLREYLHSHLLRRKTLKTIIMSVELLQVGADHREFAPSDSSVKAFRSVAVLSPHHILEGLPLHFIHRPADVPHNHIPSAPGQMSRYNRRNLNILECYPFLSVFI